MSPPTAWSQAILDIPRTSLWELVGFTPEVTDERRRFALGCGFVDTLPFGTLDDRHLIGLRAMPGRPLGSGAIVLLDLEHKVSDAVSDRMTTFLPGWLFDRFVGLSTEEWDSRLAAPQAEWEAVEALHVAWGGCAGGVLAVADALASPGVRTALSRNDARPFDWLDTWMDVQIEVLADTPRAAFQAFNKAVSWETERDDPDPLIHGVFEGAAWTAGSTTGYGLEPGQLELSFLHATRRAAAHEAGFNAVSPLARSQDTGCKRTGCNYFNAEGLATRFAEYEKDDPLVMAQKALFDRGPSAYDGLAHAEAAAELRKDERRVDACSASLSALFWNACRHRVADPSLVGLYRTLVDDAGLQSAHQTIESLLGHGDH